MLWSTLWRIVVVPVAFVVAGAASTFVLVTLALERVTQVLHGRGAEGASSILDVFDVVAQGIVLASGITILPAFLVVLVGEVARIRASLYYILGGGAALAAIPLLSQFSRSSDLVLPAPLVWQVFATAGFVGGFVYWLLAGRRA